MNSVDFCFWLQGYFELRDEDDDTFINTENTKKIKQHLDLVFVHEIDPMREKETPTTKKLLNETHSPGGAGNDILARC